MHFEITKCKLLLGKELPPYNRQKSYTYIHFDPKKGLKFGIFSTPIVEFFYASPCNPQIPARNQNYTLTNLIYLRA